MPRTAGVSGRVEVRLSLLSLRPTSVWRCLASRRMGEPICSTVRVFPSVAMDQPPLRLCAGIGVGAGIAAAALQRRHLQAPAGGDRTRAVLVLERVEGGADKVVG